MTQKGSSILTAEELQFIRDNILLLSTEEIATTLGYTPSQILHQRKQLGYTYERIRTQKCILKAKTLCGDKGYSFICIENRRTPAGNLKTHVYFEEAGEVRSQLLHHMATGRVNYKIRQSRSLKHKIPEGGGLYRFWEGDKILYVGKTRDFKERLYSHLICAARSPVFEHLHRVTKIDYCTLNDADRNILEMYLISILEPELNLADVTESKPTFEIKLPEFTELTGWG